MKKKPNLGSWVVPVSLALVMACMTNAAAGLPSWTPYPPAAAAPNHPGGGPWGGSVTRIVADDPASTSPALWAATRGGVYYSAPNSNGGLWTARNSGLESLDVRDIAVGPGSTGSRTMLAATYGKGVFLSRDSGQSWTRLTMQYHNSSGQLITDNDAVRFTAVAVDPMDANRFLAAAEKTGTDEKSRTFLTTDGGAHWEVLRTSGGYEIWDTVNRMMFSRDGSSTLFIGSGTGSYGNVYRLRPADGFVPKQLTPYKILPAVSVTGGTIPASVVDLALPDPAGNTALVLAAVGPRGVWAGSADAGVGGADSTGGSPSTYSAVLTCQNSTYPQGPGSEVTVKPNDNVTLDAVVEDDVNGLYVTGAEYFVDAVGADGTGIPMDGVYGTSSQVAVSSFFAPTVSWSPGRHTLYIHGKVSDGTNEVWGPFATVTLNLWKEFHFPGGTGGSNTNAYRVTAVTADPAHPNRMLYYLYDGLGAAATRLYEISNIRAASPVKTAMDPPEKEMRISALLATTGREFMGEAMAGAFVRYNSSGTFSHKSKGMTAYDVAGFDYQPSGAGGSTGDAGLAVAGGGSEVGNGSGGFNLWTPGQGWVRQAGDPTRFDPGRATGLVRYEGTNAVWLSVDGFGLYRGESPFTTWTPRSYGVSQTAINNVTGVAPGAPDASQNRAVVMSTSQGVYKAAKLTVTDQYGNPVQVDGWQEVLGDEDHIWWRAASDPVDPVSNFYAVAESVRRSADGMTGTAVHHSSDGGTAWAQIFPDPATGEGEPGLYFKCFAAAQDDSGQLLAGDSAFGLFESLDMGESWATASDPWNPAGLPQGNVGAVDLRRWPGGAVAKAVFLKDRGVYLSGDDGRTWTLHSVGIDGVLGAPIISRLAFTPDGRAVVASVRNRGLWSVAVGAPPEFDPLTDPTGSFGTELSFSVSAYDDETVTLSVDEATLPSGAVFDGTTFRWTPPATYDGMTVPVMFHASDGFYDTPATVRVRVTSNTPPVITVLPISAPFVTVGETVTLTITADDTESGPLPVTADALPSGAAFEGGVFTWTPALGDGGVAFDVVFRASDGFNETSETVRITVTTNRPPVISVLPTVPPFVTVGETVTLTVTADDPEDGILPVTIESLPAGAAFDGTTFTWTPPASAGPHTDIAFLADDGGLGGQARQTVRVTVNRAPVLAPVPDVTVTAGQEAAFQVSATDADSDPVTLGVEPTLPEGATFDGSWFRWTPAASQAGVHTITFSADDGRGGTHSVTATVTVNAPVDPPGGGGGGGGCFLTILGGG